MSNFISLHEKILDAHFSFQSDRRHFQAQDYVLGSVIRAWPALATSIASENVKGNSYEEKLANFFGVLNGVEHRILLVLGGIGCGKTSSIIYTLSHFGEKHSEEGILRSVHFYANLLLPDRSEPDAHWHILSSQLQKVADGLALTSEPTDQGVALLRFWSWCDGGRNVYPSTFSSYLRAYRREVRQGDIVAIEAARRDFFKTQSPRDQCIYLVSEIEFALQEPRNASVILVACIDNVDQLDHAVQSQVVAFSKIIAKSLNARVVIPVRPFTLSQDIFATGLSCFITHRPPHRLKVLGRRIDRLQEKCDTPITSAIVPKLKNLLQRLRTEHGAFTLDKAISATCGKSIRFFLRNIHNLLIRESLRIDKDSTTPFTQMAKGKIYEAYYCGGDRRLDLDQFDNLLNVSNRSDDGRFIIKLCILNILFHSQDKWMHLSELRKYIESLLGFSSELHLQALEDMGKKSSPLLWTRMSYPLSQDVFDSGQDSIYLSDIGKGYYAYLIGDAYYLRECCYSTYRHLDPARKSSRQQWRYDLRQFLKRVCGVYDSARARLLSQFGEAGLAMFDHNHNFATRFFERLRNVHKYIG